ncbi:STAS domain-containing protein [Kamptonema formosum]|uniref:STAS domain-containing protein n=1 Tax=Kamptonema formosum TaxID=331992 RepID=UPI000371D226|nr:STAS domain-containing protein [Oscillatoria sp. PCC 10802]
MALTATLTTETIVKITLDGDLDASTAQSFKEVVEKAAAANPKRLILMMEKLDYMASAGLRILMFAKQKMGAATDIYMVGTQEMVKGTIEKTGFDQAVIMLDKYDA